MLASIPGSFIGIELSAYALFAWGLYTAVRSSRLDVITLLAACLFGFAIEYLFATPTADLPLWLQKLLGGGRADSGNSYSYGTFMIMIGDVPLWVSLGWGSIIWASMRTSAGLGFSRWLAPLANGLLAASVDFALDPVAEALGWWKWQLAPGQHGLVTAFGIPLDNFLGWMMIVGGLSFSLGIGYMVIARFGAKWWLESIVVAVALVVALVLAVLLQGVFDWLYAHVTAPGAFMLVYGAAGLVTLTRLPWLRRDRPIDAWALALVGYFHLYLLAMFFTHDMRAAQPALIAFMPMLAFASVLAFAWPSLHALRQLLRASTTSSATTEAAPLPPLRT